MNGTTMYGERRAWLDEQGIVEAGEREAAMYLFSVLEQTSYEIHEILHPPPKEKK